MIDREEKSVAVKMSFYLFPQYGNIKCQNPLCDAVLTEMVKNFLEITKDCAQRNKRSAVFSNMFVNVKS
jgi:hypothetical protein